MKTIVLALILLLCALPCLGWAGEDQGLPVAIHLEPGLRLSAGDPPIFSLGLGALFQADYRRYADDARSDDRFDLRRVRLRLEGEIRRLAYRFEYEFQGSESKDITDAYAELRATPLLVPRIGQFKVPFSLEWQTATADLPFAERSMGFSLGPGRDIGLAVRGELLDEGLIYAAGLFNGDGPDGSARGSATDDPEVAGRLVVGPFRALGLNSWGDLRLGGSATYADIDLANVDLEVKSTGMFGTGRDLYVLNRNSKFGVLQDAGDRTRVGLEGAWAWGPAVALAEWVHLRYSDLEPAGGDSRDADFRSWYVAGVFHLTGERPGLDGGRYRFPPPLREVGHGGWGGWALSVRYDHFDGDEDWIVADASVSTAEADAYTATLLWTPIAPVRLLLDYTDTEFSDRIRIRVNPNGSVDYSSDERVLTGRFQLAF